MYSETGEKDFPELYAKKPRATYSAYWFECDYEGWEARLQILRYTITDTKAPERPYILNDVSPDIDLK